MKLQYRGVTYDHIPHPVKLGNTSKAGKYRGVAVNYPTLMTDVPQPQMELTYRGVTYTTGQDKKVKADKPVQPVATQAQSTTLEERLRLLMMKHHRQMVRREQAMLARVDAEVGLPVTAATGFRNHIQGLTPSPVWLSCDRSSVAMS
uniref:DUF4278 domain-containing protein n=1 Tax=Cyanothece sp. (strain PCC 7425 / ATCC 29141) TaxID=395961 RepID=B8HNN5_CYAP4